MGLIKYYIRFLARKLFRTLQFIGITIPEPIFKDSHFNGVFEVTLPDKQTLKLMSWGNRVENEFFLD